MGTGGEKEGFQYRWHYGGYIYTTLLDLQINKRTVVEQFTQVIRENSLRRGVRID